MNVFIQAIKKKIPFPKDKIAIRSRDLMNVMKYGFAAPRSYERIWVNPERLTHMIDRQQVFELTGIHRNKASGVVVNWNNVHTITPVMDDVRMQYCFRHWKEGKSWEEAGVFDIMSKTRKYGSWSRKKLEQRYHILDQAFEEAKTTGRLKTRKELNPSNFREKEGILVHIGINGELFFGGNGFHRLAIATVLSLPVIPACIGVVHRESISYLKKYRIPPETET